MKIAFCSLIFLLSLASCKTLLVDQESQRRADSLMALATIGEGPTHIMKNNFQPTAFPRLRSKVKLQVEEVTFNKKSFQNYLKRNPENPFGLSYVDSLESKPTFLKISIADRVQLINELNATDNTSIGDYLSTSKNAKMITAISWAVDQNMRNEVLNAESVYLSNEKGKEYRLVLLDEKHQAKQFSSKKGVVIGYELSGFCWGENEKHEAKIMGLIKEGKACPGKLKKDARRVVKKDIFERF